MRKKALIICVLLCVTTILVTGCRKNINEGEKKSDTEKAINGDMKTEKNKEPEKVKDTDSAEKEVGIEETDKDGEESKKDNEVDVKNQLNIKMFIPSGNYIVKFTGSDTAPSFDSVMGDGTNFQIIGTSGKGSFINVYSLKDNGIYKVYSGDLDSEEAKDGANINYLDKSNISEEIFYINDEIKVGTRFDNKEIVEVGKNLKLDNLTLQGSYIKTWEREAESQVVKVYYYSEGIGCVKYKAILNNSVVDYYELTSIEKK